MFVAPNQKEFQSLFAEKVFAMLAPEELGAFILVLANSLQDRKSQASLKSDVLAMFVELNNRRKQGELKATDDDLAVFEKIKKKGVGILSAWESIRQGEWEVVCNPMRSLRPALAFAEKVFSIFIEFYSNKFNFNKPFLQP